MFLDIYSRFVSNVIQYSHKNELFISQPSYQTKQLLYNHSEWLVDYYSIVKIANMFENIACSLLLFCSRWNVSAFSKTDVLSPW